MYGKYFNRKIDAVSEVLVSVGAYGALYYALMSHVNPGDEVRKYFVMFLRVWFLCSQEK